MTVLDLNKIIPSSTRSGLLEDWRKRFRLRVGDLAHIPGEQAACRAEQQLNLGVEISQEVYEELLELGQKLEIPDLGMAITN